MTIRLQEFQRRRRELMEQMEPNSIAILAAAPERTRNRDVEHPYRQDSDFWYLSGFPEAEAVMVLLPGREHGEYVLFCRERDRAREIWNGYRAGPEGAVADYGADDAFPINDIDDILPGSTCFAPTEAKSSNKPSRATPEFSCQPWVAISFSPLSLILISRASTMCSGPYFSTQDFTSSGCLTANEPITTRLTPVSSSCATSSSLRIPPPA